MSRRGRDFKFTNQIFGWRSLIKSSLFWALFWCCDWEESFLTSLSGGSPPASLPERRFFGKRALEEFRGRSSPSYSYSFFPLSSPFRRRKKKDGSGVPCSRACLLPWLR